MTSMGQSTWDDIKDLGDCSESFCLHVGLFVQSGHYQSFGLSNAHQIASLDGTKEFDQSQFVQGDNSGRQQPPVDLDLEYSAILPGQSVATH